MTQSTFPIHTAIIMDGNGRWAAMRGLPRTAGHVAGAKTVRRVVETAPKLGIGTLSLFAFSSDNWERPSEEVNTLFGLFREYLDSETGACAANGVRLEVIGRRDRMPPDVLSAVERAEAATSCATRLHLRIAIDYSARDAIVRAAKRLNGGPPTREAFAQLLGGDNRARDVDLLIRTGGEQRLSDFLLWECAYAELLFSPRMWPEFMSADLAKAVNEFRARDRRFGRIAPRQPAEVRERWLA
jgi:undecaprenyl diphosphate synthase